MELDSTQSATDSGRKNALPRVDPAEGLLRGTAIGRYLILEELGAGGMGVVYAAYDPELDRKVALKLVLPATGGSDTGRTRLLREAQALAKLAHPNVVTIHDVGTHGDQVWIAMEFVAGETLGAWASQRPRQWPGFLQILTDIARGVTAAHAVGLVHRDLKPDNVMIGRDGRVRVMDFGLAHGRTPVTVPEVASTLSADTNVQPGVAALALPLTAVGSVQGTPAYMAPEQWQGQEAEAATDQFGWSVMAWELLYGERPFVGETMMTLAAMVLAGQRRAPPRGRRVPGWLRRVIERGMAVEPARRWPTMAALVAALEEGRTRARLRAVALILAGVTVAGAGIEGYRQWDVAQHVASCETMGAEIDVVWNDDARQRVGDAFRATDVSYAQTTTDRVIPRLDDSAAAWKQARTDACLRANVHKDWGADILERAEWCLADRRMELGALIAEFGRANATTLQEAVSAAAGVGTVDACVDEGMLRRQPEPPAAGREAIAEVRVMLSQSNSLGLAGSYPRAQEIAKEARKQADVLGWGPLTAAAKAQEGALFEATSAYETAEAATAEAYFVAAQSGAWEVATDAATRLIRIVGEVRAHPIEGRAWARHAAVAAVYAGDSEGLWEAKRLDRLAIISLDIGEYAEAREQLQRAISLLERALGPDHPDVAASLGHLANVCQQTGENTKALALQERALAIFEESFGSNHPKVALAYTSLANTKETMGAYAEAEGLQVRALRILEDALGPKHTDVARVLGNLAGLRHKLGENVEAKALFERALMIFEATLGPDNPEIAGTLTNLANIHNAVGDYEAARVLNERALSIFERALGPDHPNVAIALVNLGSAYWATKDYVKVQELTQRAATIFEKALGAEHPAVATSLNGLADAYEATGEHAKARAQYERALSIREKALGPDHLEVASTLDNLSQVYAATRDFQKARALRERAFAIRERDLGPDHATVAASLFGLALLDLGEDHPEDALPRLERAVRIMDKHDGIQERECEVHFAFAKALLASGGDRPRALGEARKARDGFLETGRGKSEEFAEVERWLKKHDRDR